MLMSNNFIFKKSTFGRASSRLLRWRPVDKFHNFYLRDETEKVCHKLEELINA